MKTFLPEYSQMPVGKRFRPLFRLFSGENWKFVRKDGKPIDFGTSIEAVEAAKECVRRILNPTIRAEQTEVVQDILGVEAWHREKADQAARDQQEAFGAIFVRGRQITVEKRKARA